MSGKPKIKMNKKLMLTSIIIGLFVYSAGIQSAFAGSTTLPQENVNNTLISMSFSYPDQLISGTTFSIPITVDVNFQNDNVQGMMITDINMRVVQSTDAIDPYNAPAWNYVTSYSDMPHPLTRSSNSGTIYIQNWDWIYQPQGTQEISQNAKIYIQLHFYLSDAEGNHVNSGTLYTSPGQQPQITVKYIPDSSQASSFPLTLVIGIVAFAGVAAALAFFVVNKRRKTLKTP
jgi:hypothetical protein